MTGLSPADLAQCPPHLLPLLVAAVHIDLKTVCELSEQQLREEAVRAADAIAHGADMVFYGIPKKGKKAGRERFMAAWKGLVRGLAIGALMPGGVQLFGIHWIVDDRRPEVQS